MFEGTNGTVQVECGRGQPREPGDGVTELLGVPTREATPKLHTPQCGENMDELPGVGELQREGRRAGRGARGCSQESPAPKGTFGT